MRPSRVGDYLVLATLGKGGTGKVSLAVHHARDFRKLVVLKTLHSHFEQDEESVEAFLDEARLAAHLNHPNIVQTFEVGMDGDRYFLAMDYLEGVPLDRVCAYLNRHGRTIPPAVAALITRELLTGLHYAHELDSYQGKPLEIVHRDISPSNIFLCWDGTVKLVDFGIARAAERSTQTESGVIKGKFAYIAPEQVTSSKVDRRADIFSTGIVLWEMLLGKRMRARQSDVLMLREIVETPPPSLSEAAGEARFPAALVRVVDQALALAPGARYATARKMRQDLDSWLAELSQPVLKEDIAALLGDTFRGERAQRQAAVHDALRNLENEISTASSDDVSFDHEAVMTPPTPEIPKLPFIFGACAIAAALWIALSS